MRSDVFGLGESDVWLNALHGLGGNLFGFGGRLALRLSAFGEFSGDQSVGLAAALSISAHRL